MNHFRHCLLIDDDKDDCEIFSLTVAAIHEGVRMDAITEASEALAMLEGEGVAPDIIFLDLNMPKMNGLDCLRQIRQMEGLGRVPVIIYSTSTNPRDMEQARRDGATDYLIKPVSIASLRQELSRIFEKSVVSR